MHPESDTTVQLSGRDGLLSLVPAVLGYHPEESAVLITMTGPNRRIGPVIRVNLPTTEMLDSPGGAATATAMMAQSFNHDATRHVDEVALIIYTDRLDQFDPQPLARVVGLVQSLLDVIIVRNSPHEVPDELTVANLAHGRRVLADREQLTQSVQYRPGVDPSPLLAQLDTVIGRDALISRIVRNQDPDDVAELLTAAQGTPDTDPRSADLCSVLAAIAYRHGDGTLSQVAIDRVLRINPGHSLAHLMLAAMNAGLTPRRSGRPPHPITTALGPRSRRLPRGSRPVAVRIIGRCACGRSDRQPI